MQGRKPAGLIYYEGLEKPRQYIIFDKSTVMGQQEMEVFTTASLQLTAPFLDPSQCEFCRREEKWFFKNLSSQVYTFVGGKCLSQGEEVPLRDGTVIRLSNERMLTMVFFEEFVKGTEWDIINMDDGRHVVRVSDTSRGLGSLLLQYNEGRWSIMECSGERILHNQEPLQGPEAIHIDDQIQIGDTRFFFEGAGLIYGYPAQGGTLSIDIDERSVHQALKKITLLRDINLSIEPGNMVLILGGSGAGKSTFVNAITGYEKAKATITEDGIDYYRQYNQVKHRIGFVPQDNLMREEDTVWATVENAAQVRLPRNLSQEERDRRVKAVLNTFGLSGREGERVSKLSGGQKKRLSICMEFISEPSLFILDEPDSGLDGIMARELMENLRLVACQGKIVMVITHAPDRVAHLFDKVIVLAKNSVDHVGELAFYGGISEAKDFFGASSMEGIVKLVGAPAEGGEGRADEFIARYKVYNREREERKAAEDEKAKRAYIGKIEGGGTLSSAFGDAALGNVALGNAAPGSGGQGEELFKGEGEGPEAPRDYTPYKGRFAQVPVYLGKLFRLFFSQANWKVLPMAAVISLLMVYVLGEHMFRDMETTSFAALAVSCVCIWNGMFNSIQSVCKERNILKREHRAGLHISSYLGAHLIYQAVVCILQVLIILWVFRAAGVMVPDTGLVTGSFWGDLFVSCFLITYASDMLALMISCMVKTTTSAMTLMPFFLIVQLVFAGQVFPIRGEMAQRISQLSISNWGIKAVCVAADYNDQNSMIISTAVNTLQTTDPDDLVGKLKKVLTLEEVEDRLGAYTGSKLYKEEYTYTKARLLTIWSVLLLHGLVYVLIGLAFLENVDRDKR